MVVNLRSINNILKMTFKNFYFVPFLAIFPQANMPHRNSSSSLNIHATELVSALKYDHCHGQSVDM